MKLELFQIDAFAKALFAGNPAAVVPLESWLPETKMQAIAQENNLAETAFFVPGEAGYHIRWFTPAAEVSLCGHATLASAFVLTEFPGEAAETIRFDSASGPLWVARNSAGLLELNFPAQAPHAVDAPEQLVKGLALAGWAFECLALEDFLVVLESAEQLRALQPDYGQLQQLDLRGVIVTSPADQPQYDFYARFFAPKLQVPEDPVTGSAYTQLVPYWQRRLGRTEFMARQLSPRGGDVYCSLAEDRVLIAGNAVCYLRGEIEVD